MLNIPERFDLAAMGHNAPACIATLPEAMTIGAVDRIAPVMASVSMCTNGRIW